MKKTTPPVIDHGSLTWFKATASSDSGACVEVAWAPQSRVATRDSKNPDGPVLLFTGAAWVAFIDSARNGEFNLPT